MVVRIIGLLTLISVLHTTSGTQAYPLQPISPYDNIFAGTAAQLAPLSTRGEWNRPQFTLQYQQRLQQQQLLQQQRKEHIAQELDHQDQLQQLQLVHNQQQPPPPFPFPSRLPPQQSYLNKVLRRDPLLDSTSGLPPTPPYSYYPLPTLVVRADGQLPQLSSDASTLLSLPPLPLPASAPAGVVDLSTPVGACEVCMYAVQMKQRGTPYLCANINNPDMQVLCSSTLAAMLAQNRQQVYWNNYGCIRRGTDYLETWIRPCPPSVVCSWLLMPAGTTDIQFPLFCVC